MKKSESDDSSRVSLNHSGQVALVMVLIMTVVSAIAVSIASRSTVETRVQQMYEENTQAVMTAQAGLEEALAQNAPVSGSLSAGKDYAVSVGDTGSNSILSEKINPGDVFEVNLDGAVGITGIKVYWNPAVAGQRPSLFISEVRSDRSIDYAFDTEGTGGFTQVSSGGSLTGTTFSYVTPSEISVISGSSLSLRVTVLGASAILGFEPIGGVFPSQSTTYKSVANVITGGSTVKYGLEYSESKTNLLPPVFDYVLFSGGSIVQ
ncbi:hypothetical protein A3K29_04295 [Candidatus Collierbacteria bacterium RIFOXYB2_FULL_46_14]|uniref:Type 4 fimbrial biogenesis protein PilX N-terminal domain-containing protein n=1 Tax=Candidatus Collierbacteria bacterium GW2011_GWA2_46_26 TaxID=1618381 RepID=A0A0G1PL99_9BACT|nr:MAG: hypothetical protein UW29_C0002G0039 [Candidatus Collierbacteria bacterium GW2011_GWC2_44_13]KKU33516.1 MAG: hypothetical protein UX47_C0003G0039 [Candidatus Collierbacteria bacterium GW2011_GWA2_46_26]OGD73321.1 MAG: hypothetical protein A3K29_04295 [Candidatus Collierbacteria bacterium RIFOXYB2_FULL_46_14]OGD76363.1 MAG: hypothetical protein A3K43_04295 [Candidatus Collierbacteria bacterium RIFOXYA2_FULL_46_20]OGD77699.1 MAG: hypothetical protein A3K39_04295 [Candidatus Collierbacteri